MRRAARARAAVVLVAVALPVLAGCRSDPGVAAYVGDEQITVAELDAAVDERLADERIAEYAAGGEDEFTRRVLDGLVAREVHAAAAERYGVRVGEEEVGDRIEELLAEEDPEAVYAQLAQQGIGRADVRETIRQQLLRREIAEAEGQAGSLDEAALRERYDEVRESLAEVEFGYVTVPDQAIADQLVADLTAEPGRYAEFAALFAGPFTLAELQRQPAGELPPAFAERLDTTAPGTAFAVPVPDAGGVVVGFLGSTVYPPFEEVRPQLEDEAAAGVEATGAELVDGVREDLDVTVNPRYGVLREGRLVPGDGVVDLLEDDAAATPPAE
ncbi:peptidylprolyl isomerase [Blastococcus saxobsidens]|nr:peptidylprolyl isomerase [Blastococcus saxobsidens]